MWSPILLTDFLEASQPEWSEGAKNQQGWQCMV